ncbi:MAG: MFS transporter [Gammaproteobacteria bacterium]|nr:MFS transporter [Gammaproteobacteria bacterium]
MTLTTKQELKNNWVVLAIAFALVFFSFGVPNFSLPWIYQPAMEEFGWTNAQANLLSTAKFLVGAVAALGMGIMIDKVGGKFSVLLGALSGGFAMLLFLVATNLPVYYLAGGLLGLSASSIVAAMKVIVSRLFDINQGLAIGIVLGGTSAGQLVMPVVWSPLLDSGMNWREIFAWLSLGSFLISTPLWIIFMSRTGSVQDTINASSAKHKDGLTMWGHFKEVCQEKGFWYLAIAIFLVSAVDQALMQNYVTFLRNDRGLNHRDFYWLISLVTVLAIASKIGSGWIYDKYSIPGIRFFYFLLGVSVILALPVTGLATMAIFLTVRNIAHGGMIVEAPVITKHYLGPRNLGMTIGIVSVCVNLGFAAGPPFLGYLYDLNGNYTMGFVIYSGIAFLACALLLPLKPRYWTPPSKRESQEDGENVSGLQPSGA